MVEPVLIQGSDLSDTNMLCGKKKGVMSHILFSEGKHSKHYIMSWIIFIKNFVINRDVK